MRDFIPQPIVIREHAKFTLVQIGSRIETLAGHSSWFTAAEIASNPGHYLRPALKPLMDKIVAGEIAGIVSTKIDGQPAQIAVTNEHYALGAPERARHAEWNAETMRQVAQRRAFFDGQNEGGEGYNPYRA